MTNPIKFISAVRRTMKDTTWLTASQTRRDTSTVIVMSLFFVAFLGIVDFLAQSGANLLIK